MEFALQNYKGVLNYDHIQHIITVFQPQDSTLPAFIEKHAKEKWVWIDVSHLTPIEEVDNLQLLLNIWSKYKEYNIGFILNIATSSPTLIFEFMKAGARYMFSNIVDDWDTLSHMIALGVRCIIVGNALGFELDKVAEVLHKYWILVWVYPNIAQSTCSTTPDMKKFWIRPEDLKEYEPYVDVVKMAYPKGEPKKQIPYLNIYRHGAADGALNDFIIGWRNKDIPVISYKLPETLTKQRIKCGKRCLKGSKCKACEGLLQIAKKQHELSTAASNSTLEET